mmetsp:Transcript_12344/g.13658  ORF Transcript_12344/g.13658 Transcript_12344/m.13658 type:complete len:491 (+) Transcript_12344:30-1502(+)
MNFTALVDNVTEFKDDLQQTEMPLPVESFNALEQIYNHIKNQLDITIHLLLDDPGNDFSLIEILLQSNDSLDGYWLRFKTRVEASKSEPKSGVESTGVVNPFKDDVITSEADKISEREDGIVIVVKGEKGSGEDKEDKIENKSEEKDDVKDDTDQPAQKPRKRRRKKRRNVQKEKEDEEEQEPIIRKKKRKKKLPETIECPICIDDVKMEDAYMFDCGHSYCRECLDMYVKEKINQNDVLDLCCPHPECDSEIPHNHLKELVDTETFDRYDELALKAALNRDPNCRWCPSCGDAIIGDPQYRRLRCYSCSHEFCFECNEDFHVGTCEDFQKWKVENGLVDEKYVEWADENTRKCPKCKSRIQKNSGCNHMTCGNCNYQFCWLCGRKYTSNHFDVWNVLGCPALQSGKKENYGAARRMGMRIGIATGIGAAVIFGGALALALAIPVLVIGGPIFGGYHFVKYRRRKRKRKARYLPTPRKINRDDIDDLDIL